MVVARLSLPPLKLLLSLMAVLVLLAFLAQQVSHPFRLAGGVGVAVAAIVLILRAAAQQVVGMVLEVPAMGLERAWTFAGVEAPANLLFGQALTRRSVVCLLVQDCSSC